MRREQRVTLQINKDAHAAVRRASDAFGLKQSAMVSAMARGWEMLDPDAQAKALRPGAEAIPNRSQMAEMLEGMLRQLHHGRA